MTRRISPEALALLKQLEGLRLHAYPDPASPLGRALRRAGIFDAVTRGRAVPAHLEHLSGAPWTIGYGSTGPHVRPGEVITEAEAEALLIEDLRRFEDAVDSLVTVPLTDYQFGALVLLAFNIGIAAFRKSTLLRKLNAGDYAGAQAQFAVWRIANGEVEPGLVTRRAAEAAFFGRGMFAASRTVEPDGPKPLSRSKTIGGAAVTGGASLAAIAPELVEVARETSWTAEGTLKLVLLVIILIGTAVTIWERYKRRRETGE